MTSPLSFYQNRENGVAKMKKVLSLTLIISGILLFLYPSMSNLYTDYQQKKMISEWEANSFETDAAADTFNERDVNVSLDELNEVFSMNKEQAVEAGVKEDEEVAEPIVKENENTVELESSNNDGTAPKKKSTVSQKNGVLGVIEINKINLRLPILYGASKSNLDLASGLLKGTSLPGAPGNSAIAAHRSRSYGSMFNRLDEIGAGDVVTVRDKKGTYQYKVYETLVVEPQDVSVLNSSRDEKTLTLITCTPIDTATHRLIVKAEMLP